MFSISFKLSAPARVPPPRMTQEHGATNRAGPADRALQVRVRWSIFVVLLLLFAAGTSAGTHAQRSALGAARQVLLRGKKTCAF